MADKSHRYKHTAADIPDSWVLIDIKGFLPEVPWLPPSATKRMCSVSVTHPFLCLIKVVKIDSFMICDWMSWSGR